MGAAGRVYRSLGTTSNRCNSHMKALVSIGAGILAFIIVLSMFAGTYNGLVSKSAQVDGAWAEVEAQYQRRFDLVPNLVGATKGALGQEQKVFGDIAEARTHYAGTAPGSNERVQATVQYESALARLMVIVEAYPQLRSLDTVNRLMDELAGTENRVLIARNRYNVEVKEYNVQVTSFPAFIFARMYGFEARDYFQPDEGAQNAPTVDLTI